jgi:hypothetical protein
MASLGRRVVSSVVVVGGLVLAGAGGTAEVRAQSSCDPSYPDFCIPPAWEVGDLDCAQAGGTWFTVYQPDPHGFDADYNGYGCEGDYEGATTELSETQSIVAPADAGAAPVVESSGTALLGPDGTYSVVDTAPSYGEPVYEEPVGIASDCDPSYPDLCIPPGSADLNCDYVFGLGLRSITVYAPDPHGFDGDGNGLGCEG